MNRMSNRQTGVAQHQPLTIELLAEKSIVSPIAMSGIPDDRVRDMRQMAAKLVLASGIRQQAHQL